MTTQTVQSTVTFRGAFRLSSFDHDLPAGEYRVITEQEPLDVNTLDHSAFRRIATYLRTPALDRAQGDSELNPVDARDLERALLKDRGEAL
jgi:hypothetical protein